MTKSSSDAPLSTDERFTFLVAGRRMQHNTVRWRVATNRHPEISGRDWGWIDGAGGENTWSDDKVFNRQSANTATKMHNDWLEEQKPISIRLIEANERLRKASERMAMANKELDAAEREHSEALALVDSLEEKLSV